MFYFDIDKQRRIGYTFIAVNIPETAGGAKAAEMGDARPAEAEVS